MRILLIATNMHRRLMSRMNAQPAPIGLAYIASHLDPNRHTLKILDLMFSEDYLGDTETTVREFQPNLIGISLRNLDNSSYMDPQWALPTTKEVIQRIRTITSSPIVCGGPGFSLLPEECFRYLGPDLGVAGDGGETFAQLADSIESGETYKNLPGLIHKDSNGQLVYKGLAYSSFSKPPRLEELDMPGYERAGFGIGIVTKLDDSFSHSIERDNGNQTWRVLSLKDPYHKDQFTYNEPSDSFTCPQGQTLKFIRIQHTNGVPLRLYRASEAVCQVCPAFGVCTRAKEIGRSLAIGPHDAVLRRHRAWMSTSAAREAYKLRKQLVEPVFGIIKEQQGARRFLLRGLVNVATEWTMLATAFNLRTLWRVWRSSPFIGLFNGPEPCPVS